VPGAPPVSPDPPVRVFILADVRLYREGLAQALAQFDALDVVGCAPADQDGFATVSATSPAVVLIDASSIHDGAAVNEASDRSGARVVACGVAGRDDEVVGCAHAGVAGYVTRDASLEELVATLLTVAQGDVACPPRIAGIVLRRLAAVAAHSTPNLEVRLTLRERQIVALVDQGLCNKEIAVRLGVEVSTIKNHVHNLLQKFGAKRRGEAAARARRLAVGWSPARPGFGVGLLVWLAVLTWSTTACNDPTPPPPPPPPPPLSSLPCTTWVGGRCWVYLGPDSVDVRAVAEVGSELWIGTTTRGILWYDTQARSWRDLAFPGKSLRSIVVVPSTGAIWVTVNGYPDTTHSYLYLGSDSLSAAGGRIWLPRDGGLAAQNHFAGMVGPFAIDPLDDTRLLLKVPGGLFLSVDRGGTWERVLGGPYSLVAYNALAVSSANGVRAWVGGGNTVLHQQFVLRSDDRGRTWEETSRPGPEGYGGVVALVADREDADVVVASIWGSLWATSDGGLTWRTVLELAHQGRAAWAFAMTDTMVVAVSDEWLSDWVPGVLGLYVAPAVEASRSALPTPADAAAGYSVMVDRDGQLVIGTIRGVWLVRD